MWKWAFIRSFMVVMQTLFYIISMEFFFVEAQMSPPAKCPLWRGVRKDGCFCRLEFSPHVMNVHGFDFQGR